jgi:hypothetical protein
MRDVDLETLLALEIPAPRPSRRRITKARALTAFETTYHGGHQRGIGATVARTLVRSSQPVWHMIAETFDNPQWNSQALPILIGLGASLIAATIFLTGLTAMLLLAV